MSSPNTSEFVTTTLANYSGQIDDNVSDNNALLNRLKKRGKTKPADGGTVIYQELSYAENATYQRYSGYDTLNISPSDVLTAAEFAWKQVAVAVTMSGLEELINSGSERMFDLLEARIEVAMATAYNGMSVDLYSDGTASNGKQIGGLQLLVADDPTTGTAGAINRATSTNAFWRNQKFHNSSDAAASSVGNMRSLMNKLYNKCTRGTDKPDLLLFDDTFYELYEESLQGLMRVTQADEADAGFVSLKYKGADVVLDGGQGGACPAKHGYFLNTKHIWLRPHPQRNFKPLPQVNAINQDAMVKLIGWAGNLTTSNAALQGVMFED